MRFYIVEGYRIHGTNLFHPSCINLMTLQNIFNVEGLILDTRHSQDRDTHFAYSLLIGRPYPRPASVPTPV